MMYCPTARRRKFEKFTNIHEHTKFLRMSPITPLEVFCKDFIDIIYENTSFHILEEFIRLQYVYFLTKASFSNRWVIVNLLPQYVR